MFGVQGGIGVVFELEVSRYLACGPFRDRVTLMGMCVLDVGVRVSGRVMLRVWFSVRVSVRRGLCLGLRLSILLTLH